MCLFRDMFPFHLGLWSMTSSRRHPLCSRLVSRLFTFAEPFARAFRSGPSSLVESAGATAASLWLRVKYQRGAALSSEIWPGTRDSSLSSVLMNGRTNGQTAFSVSARFGKGGSAWCKSSHLVRNKVLRAAASSSLDPRLGPVALLCARRGRSKMLRFVSLRHSWVHRGQGYFPGYCLKTPWHAVGMWARAHFCWGSWQGKELLKERLGIAKSHLNTYLVW